MKNILLIDCYDSFTYNLYQQIGSLDKEPRVVKNDSKINEILKYDFDKIILSPGPGSPKEAGICNEIIEKTEKPILGVCLGHQVLVSKYGGKVIENKTIHGKQDRIYHKNTELFKNLPQGFKAGRYHSLIAQKIPKEFEITAKTKNEEIMAVEHKRKPIYGIQFHTESILTPKGEKIIKNFLST